MVSKKRRLLLVEEEDDVANDKNRIQCDDNDLSKYCLNGGKCANNGIDADSPCLCPHGNYPGPHCEESCSLECYNNSQCIFGSSTWGSRDGMACVDNNSSSDNNNNNDCPKGYAGVQCEYQAQICGDNDLVCLHGSKCVKDDVEGFRCECDDQTQKDGNTCPNNREPEFCVPDPGHLEYYGGMAVVAFCLNGGKCIDTQIDGSIFPVCDCPPLFTGPRCEFLGDNELHHNSTIPTPIRTPETMDTIKPRHFGMITIVILLSGLLVLSSFYVGKKCRKRRQQRHEAAMNMNLQAFREERGDGATNNIPSSQKSSWFSIPLFRMSKSPFPLSPVRAGIKRKDSLRLSHHIRRSSRSSDSFDDEFGHNSINSFDRGIIRSDSFTRNGVIRSDSMDRDSIRSTSRGGIRSGPHRADSFNLTHRENSNFRFGFMRSDSLKDSMQEIKFV